MTKTVPKINKVLKVKQEENEENIKEKKKEIPCKYFIEKRCMRALKSAN